MIFAKIISKNLSSKHEQKLLDSTKKKKKPATDTLKTTSRAIHKRTEATGDLVRNKVVDTITRAASQIVKSKLTMPTQIRETLIGGPIETTKEKCILNRKATANYS